MCACSVLTPAAVGAYSFAMQLKKALFKVSCVFAVFIAPHLLYAQMAGAVSAKADALEVRSPSRSAAIKLADLKTLPHVNVSVHNPHTNAEESYAGVRVADLFAKLNMGVPLGEELRGKALKGYIVATGSDGYEAVIALGEIDPDFHPGEVIVADSMNGEPLDAHNGPFRLIVSEDKRPARCVRNLVSLEVKMAD